jgi:hypothetical protein
MIREEVVMTSRFREVLSYAAVAVVSLAAGAALACSAGRASAARPLDAVTTHGEWVQVRRGAD